jgi:hypothetical protein
MSRGLGMVVHTIIPATWEVEVGGLVFEAGLKPYFKKPTKSKRTEAMAQVVESLPNKWNP